MIKKCLSAVLIIILFNLQVHGQSYESDSRNLKTLMDFLSIPNNAQQQDDILLNSEWLTVAFNKMGFESKMLTEPTTYFFASKKLNRSLPTVLFYMHMDGQSVDPEKWFQDNPYAPVIKLSQEENTRNFLTTEFAVNNYREKDVRIYARSASDDKGPIAMFISALENLGRKGKTPAYNLKVILDTEEEQGSPHILDMVKNNEDMLSADYFVVFDGPMHDSGKPTLLFGARGITTLKLEVYAMEKPQHSGHYGNFGPNPIFRASHLLSSFKDSEGRVLINGYYDGINLNKMVLQLLGEVPDDKLLLKHRAGFKTAESVASTYQEAMQYPSLNVKGMQAGWVGKQSRTIVPDKAIIEMDIRTVPESNPDSLITKIKKHIVGEGFTLIDRPARTSDLLEFDKPLYLQYRHLMFPFRTDINSTIGQWLQRAVKKEGAKTVLIRMTGGSVPLSFFINTLQLPTVIVPLVNPDNNQHSPNENLKLTHYFDGIQTIETILTTPI